MLETILITKVVQWIKDENINKNKMFELFGDRVQRQSQPDTNLHLTFAIVHL